MRPVYRLLALLVLAVCSACEKPQPHEAPPQTSVATKKAAVVASAEACPVEAEGTRKPSQLVYTGPSEAVYAEHPLLSAHLATDSGVPLAARLVTFQLGALGVSGTTDEAGVVSVSLPADARPGELPLTVSFAGDTTQEPASASLPFTLRRAPTQLSLASASTLAVGASHTLSARLTRYDETPVAGASVAFQLAGRSATAKTDGAGVATVTLPLAATPTGPAPLTAAFAGDDFHEPSADALTVTRYQPTRFLLWGGNTPGLQLGQRVNFWGHSWEKQVTGGDYAAHAELKGWAASLPAFALCQPAARASTHPRLTPGCWSTKGGQSFPPASLPEYIGVLITTATAKQGGEVYGNVAALAVVKVDPEPAYGGVPGKPGFGVLVDVIDPGSLLPPVPAVSLTQRQPLKVAPGETFDVQAELANLTAAPAQQVVLTERFDLTTPPTAEHTAGTLAPSEQRAVAFSQTVPSVPTRGAGESSADYLRRLSSFDGRALFSQGAVRFIDPHGRPTRPARAASSSRLLLPRLTVALSAPPCVTPGALVPYTVTVHNLGLGLAKSGTATVLFPDGTKAEVPLEAMDSRQGATHTVYWTVPEAPAVQPGESPAAYAARLHALDGQVLTASVELVWKDKRGTDYGSVTQQVRSIERLPILVAAAGQVPALLPSQTAPLKYAVKNVGSGKAMDARFRVTPPEGAPTEVGPFALASGEEKPVELTAQAPAFPARGAAESEADYKARLLAAHNRPLLFGHQLTWSDAVGGGYGPVPGEVRTFVILPVLELAMTGPATAQSGDTLQYTLTVRNRGLADATGVAVAVTLPDGTTRTLALPSPVLARGASVTLQVSHTLPTTGVPEKVAARAQVVWQDAVANGYGPLSAGVETVVERGNLPPVVNAGADVTVTLPATASLLGTVTDDGLPEGAVLTHHWLKVSGPGTVTFGDTLQLATPATFSEPGTYVLRLFASDSQLTALDELTVVVLPREGSGTTVDVSNPKPGDTVINVVVDGNQIRLDNTTRAFNFIWVAVSSKGTVVKLDTETGKVLAEYWTSPNGQPKDPSRTTVDKNGNVWATNRAGNSVLHIGLVENGQCKDRNGNGVIDTSTGYGDIRAWTNAGNADGNGGVTTAQDECILHYVKVRSSGTRHVSVDENNDVWVSGTGGRYFDLIDGNTGVIKRQENSVGYGGYGGLIDKKGVIWSSNPLLRWDTALPLNGANGVNWRGYGHDSYGLCIDSQGNVWNTSLYGGQIRKFAPDGSLLGSYWQGFNNAQGCVVDKNDDVWVAHVVWGSRTVGHLKNDGTFVGNVPVPSGPTGVAVDGKGKIWSTNHDSGNVTRIDPKLGPLGADGKTRVGAVDFTSPHLGGVLYNYSDMTGSTLGGAPENGTFSTVYDSQKPGAEWGKVAWTGQVCGDGALTVTAASSPDGVSFSAPVTAANGQDLTLPNGRYLKVSVSFKRSSTGDSPVLSSLTIGTAQYVMQAPLNEPPSVHAGRDRAVTQPNPLRLSASACDDGLPGAQPLALAWTQVSGPGSATFSAPAREATDVTFNAPGTYVLRLTARDGALQGHDDVTVTTLPHNEPPTVGAGAPVGINLPETAELNGTVTDDGLPTDKAVTVTWSKVSGPGTVTFTPADQLHTTASFSAGGTYVLRLTAFDGHLEASADVTVVANAPPPANKPPVVSAGANVSGPFGPMLNLAGSVTDDGLPSGKPLTRTWSKVSGPGTVSFVNASSATTPASFSAPGLYVLRLTASDTEFTTSSDVSVSVGAPASTNTPPKVSPGANLALTLPETTATLRGAVTDDGQPEGAPLTTGWTQVRGPATVIFSDASQPVTQAQFPAAGTYVLRLTSSDTHFTAWAEVAVVVSPAPAMNLSPVVDAGPSQSVTLPTRTVTLVGAVTDDGQPAGAGLNLTWSKVSGPGTVTFANNKVASTTATFSAAGVYQLRLSASDSQLTGSADVIITVNPTPPGNQPPVVSVASSHTVTLPDNLVTLNETVTDDGQPAGIIEGWWEKVSGPGPVVFDRNAQGRTTARFTVAGDYALRVTASDTELSASALVQVKVLPDVNNKAPLVTARGPATVLIPGTASLSGSVTDDGLPAYGALTVNWSKVEGPGNVTFSRPNQVSTAAAFSAGGTYVLGLTASDGEKQASATVTVAVTATNQAPVVSAGPDKALEFPARTVTLSGSALDDGLPAGATLTYVWSVVDGPGDVTFSAPQQPTTSATLPVLGTYVLRLTVSDGVKSASDDVVVTLNGPSNYPPTVQLGASLTATMPGTATLEGRVTDDGVPGAPLTFAWSQVSGPGSVSFEDATQARTVASFPTPGTYVLRLTASDGVLSASGDVIVTGRPGGSNLAPEIDSQPVTTARTGELYTYAVLATDGNGDLLTFSVEQGPGDMTIHTTTGLLSWRPAPGAVGPVGVVVRAKDPAGLFDDQAFTLNVTAGEAVPRITSKPVLVAVAGTTYVYPAGASDVDDTSLTWSVSGPAGMAVDASGTVTWAVPADAQGTYPVTVTVRDAAGHTTTQGFTLGVAIPGDTRAPVVTLSSPAYGDTIGTLRQVVGTVSDDDLAGYTVTVCRLGVADGCTVLAEGFQSVTAGKLADIDPLTLANGRYTLTVSAKDAAGHTRSAKAELIVQTEGRKAPVMRLEFPEFEIPTQTATVKVRRVYDGLDLSLGMLGRGWRYEWDMGRVTQPRPLETGWSVELDTSGFIPYFTIRPTVDHPITVQLDDGRLYEFEVYLEHDGSLSSIHPATPVIHEISGTGSTLTLLRSDFSAYGDSELIVESGIVFESDLEFEWKPRYGQLETSFGETVVFDLTTGKIVAFTDGAGIKLEMLPTGLRMNGTELLRFEYAADGMVGRATDVTSGTRVSYQRDAAGNLVKATTVDGSAQTFTYDEQGRMTGYFVPGTGLERFEHDERGRVILHVTASGGVMRTTYEDDVRRVIVKDAAGNTVINEYDATGNVVRTTDPLGHVTKFTYKPGTSLETTRTDPLGNTWTTEYDARGRRSAFINPLGEKTTLAYDNRSGRVLAVTDGEGRTFRETQDEAGRINAFVLPDGSVARQFSYPNASTLVSTDAQGRKLTTVHDARGRMVSQTDHHGRTVTTTYNDTTLTATIQRADGTTSQTAYDRAGRVTRLTMGSSGTIQYVFNGADPFVESIIRPDGGKVEYKRGADGNVTSVLVDGKPVQQSRFDALGRLVSVQQNGLLRTYAYDAAGRLTQESTAQGSVQYAYDAAGRITEMMSSSGVRRGFGYDKAGRLTTVADGTGQSFGVDYDKSGLITDISTTNGRGYHITHDANGRRNGITYPGGVSASWTYEVSDDFDEAPPIKSMSDLEGVLWTYAYDQRGRLEQITDGTGATTRYQRNNGGMVSEVKDALGRSTLFDWTGGSLRKVTTPEGRTQHYTQDGMGRVQTWTRADGTVVSYTHAADRTVTHLPGGGTFEERRDLALGTRTSQGAPGGDVTAWTDAEGRTTQLQVSDGASVSVSYTLEGRISTVDATTPGGATFSTQYGYDASGRLRSLVEPGGATSLYGYDKLGRLTSIERPNGTRSTYTYGELDRPTRIQHTRGNAVLATYTYGYDTRGRVTSAQTPEGAFQYEYDALSRLAVERKLQGGTVVEELRRVYDAVGNLQQITDSRGLTTFSYDKDDRLLSSDGPDGLKTYTYSDRGALQRIDAPEGVTRFTYDALDRLTEVTLPDGQRVSYAYDSAGRLLARTDAQGTRRCLPMPTTPHQDFEDCAVEYTESGMERPEARVFGPEGIASLHGPTQTRYTLDALQGNVVGVTDGTGTVLGTADYTPFGQRSASGAAVAYGFTGERQDEATGLVFLRARWYHPQTGRFLTPDTYGAESSDPRTLHRYQYALANPLNRRDPSGAFSLGEVSIAISISDVMRGIEGTLKICLQNKMKAEIFTAVAEWAAKRFLAPVAEAAFNQLLKKFGGGFLAYGLEKDFHEDIAKILCGADSDLGRDDSVFSRFFEFEYIVDDCGNPKKRGTGKSSLVDCFEAFRTQQGIDIVFEGKLGIELKLSKDTFKEKQLVRYCRWGAEQGAHVFLYAYAQMPTEKDKVLDESAELCWKCWQKEGNQYAGACTGNKATIGSVFFALGMSKEKKGVHFYKPDPNKLCN